MPFAFDYFRVVASLQYAHGSHWHSVFDCDSFDLVFDFAASIPILSSHADRTFTDIIVTVRLRLSAVRSILDAILAFGSRLFQLGALRTHADSVRLADPIYSLGATCDLFRFRFPSTKSFGTHTPSLASLSAIAFAILRNYDCLTEAIRIAHANCATLRNAFSILFGCRIPLTFCQPPCIVRIRFAFQMDMIGSIFDSRL
jgi:hypothetical protein